MKPRELMVLQKLTQIRAITFALISADYFVELNSKMLAVYWDRT